MKKEILKKNNHPLHISKVIKKIPPHLLLKKKKFLKEPTLRQKAVMVMVANGGKSKAKILRKAGFSEAVARNPKKVFDSPPVKEAVDTVIADLEEERRQIIEALKGKRHKAGYRDLIDGLDKVTKNIELLSGRPTDRSGFSLSPDEEKEFDELLKRNQ